jgi:hypothetical protein
MSNSSTCTNVCPTGQFGSSNICIGTLGRAFDYVFTKIKRFWVDSSTAVRFNAGLTSNTEDSDPLSFKQRGLYFDGVDDILTYDPAS